MANKSRISLVHFSCRHLVIDRGTDGYRIYEKPCFLPPKEGIETQKGIKIIFCEKYVGLSRRRHPRGTGH